MAIGSVGACAGSRGRPVRLDQRLSVRPRSAAAVAGDDLHRHRSAGGVDGIDDLQPRGAQQRAGTIACFVAAGLATGAALPFLVHWPTRRQSMVFSLTSTATIAAACLSFSNPYVGLMGCTTFSVIGGFVATSTPGEKRFSTLGWPRSVPRCWLLGSSPQRVMSPWRPRGSRSCGAEYRPAVRHRVAGPHLACRPA